MKRFGVFMSKISVGPAKRLFRNQPEDMAKYYLYIMASTGIVHVLHRYEKHLEYKKGYRAGRLAPMELVPLENQESNVAF